MVSESELSLHSSLQQLQNPANQLTTNADKKIFSIACASPQTFHTAQLALRMVLSFCRRTHFVVLYYLKKTIQRYTHFDG